MNERCAVERKMPQMKKDAQINNRSIAERTMRRGIWRRNSINGRSRKIPSELM